VLGSLPLKFGTRSKAERGYRFALGKVEGGRDPEKAKPAKIRAHDTCAKAFAAVLASAARQITVNRQALLQSDDPESAHQMRVGVRRLRSALRALRPLIGRASLWSFERSARDIGRCVGELRDADVLISGIYNPTRAVAADKVGFDQLHETLLRNRQAKREDVRRELTGRAWTRFQLYLALWPSTLEENRALDRSVKKHARTMLAKTWRRARKLGERLASLNPEERHAMRKTLKQLRYQAEFFARRSTGKAHMHLSNSSRPCRTCSVISMTCTWLRGYSRWRGQAPSLPEPPATLWAGTKRRHATSGGRPSRLGNLSSAPRSFGKFLRILWKPRFQR
jgi:triphosphatase